jgi:PadR family transcriptional regulator, regulatory protein PadR
MTDLLTTPSRGTFLVLLALRSGPKHGYEIASHLAERSRGFFTLSFGALYPILHRLEKGGLVSARWEAVGAKGAKQRKVYALTAKGRKALVAERASFEAVAGAFARLIGDEG